MLEVGIRVGLGSSLNPAKENYALKIQNTSLAQIVKVSSWMEQEESERKIEKNFASQLHAFPYSNNEQNFDLIFKIVGYRGVL